jgi:hypothetical protein
MEDAKPIAIEVWNHLQELLEHESSPYLSKDKFTLQRDAFVRLADEDVVSDVPFLSYGHAEVTSDEVLDFAMYLLQYEAAFDLGPVSFEIPYDALAFDSTEYHFKQGSLGRPDPRVIASNILITIKLLLTGQIALGETFKNGNLVAAETFLMGFEDRPYPIGISGRFGWFQKEGDTYVVKQNKLLQQHIKVSSDYPLLPPIVNGSRVLRGRKVDNIYDLEPLTNKQLKSLHSDSTLHELAGKPDEEGEWSYFYRKLEFWISVVAVVGPILYLRYSTHTPSIFHSDWFLAFARFGSWILIIGLAAILLGRRHRIEANGRRTVSQSIEEWISAFGGIRLFSIIIQLLIAYVYLLTPLWTPKNDFVHLYNGLAMFGQFPVMYLLPALSGGSLIVLGVRRLFGVRALRIIYLVLTVALTIALYGINQAYMNTADNAPQLSDPVTYSIILLPVLLVIYAVAGVRSKRLRAAEGA